jgi:cytochrome c5
MRNHQALHCNGPRNDLSRLRVPFAALALALPFLTGNGAFAATGADVVKVQCVRCHEAGTGGAPKPGDKAAWAPRFNKGVDALVLTAIRGHGGMPPRGGKADLTDAELRGAVLYLFDPAGPPKEAPAGARPAAAGGTGMQRVSVGGLDVYLGRISAERMRAFPAGSPEAKMHGGIPGGSGYHHVNVSVFDAATQAPLAGATVSLDVEQLGMGREAKALEPLTVAGSTSYGAYVRLVPKNAYAFYVRVQKPGAAKPIEAKFQERLN